MSDEAREEVRNAFNLPPSESPVRILIATDAAPEGINLQACCANIIHFDVPWNPARLESETAASIARYNRVRAERRRSTHPARCSQGRRVCNLYPARATRQLASHARPSAPHTYARPIVLGFSRASSTARELRADQEARRPDLRSFICNTLSFNACYHASSRRGLAITI